jgi:hypothetical protein
MEDPLCILAKDQIHLVLGKTKLSPRLLYRLDGAFRITDPMGIVDSRQHFIAGL